MSGIDNYRTYVLSKWDTGGWQIAGDRYRAKKAVAAIEWLVQRGFLLEDNRMFRITDAGIERVQSWRRSPQEPHP
jgi:hypothetical protein